MNNETQALFVTVRDDLDLPVIAALRLLAAKLNLRRPILLKDVLKISNQKSAISNSSTPCSSLRPTSARFFAMELATRFWCKAKKHPARRCA